MLDVIEKSEKKTRLVHQMGDGNWKSDVLEKREEGEKLPVDQMLHAMPLSSQYPISEVL